MIEVIVILSLLTLIGVQEYYNRKERNRLTNALMSKNLADFRALQWDDKKKPEKKVVETNDTAPLSQLSDQDFEKHIAKINKG